MKRGTPSCWKYNLLHYLFYPLIGHYNFHFYQIQIMTWLITRKIYSKLKNEVPFFSKNILESLIYIFLPLCWIFLFLVDARISNNLFWKIWFINFSTKGFLIAALYSININQHKWAFRTPFPNRTKQHFIEYEYPNGSINVNEVFFE